MDVVYNLKSATSGTGTNTIDSPHKGWLDFIGDPVVVANPYGEIVYANKAAGGLLYSEQDKLKGQQVSRWCPQFSQWCDEAKSLGAEVSGFVCKGRTDIQLSINDTKHIDYTVSVIFDATEQHQEFILTLRDVTDFQRKVSHLTNLAYKDSLTGAHNRRYLDNHAKKLATATDEIRTYSVALIDIDDFKKLNDRYGHWVGDQVLIIVAKRIKKCLRQKDITARLGGDEFCSLLDGVPEDLDNIANKLRFAFQQPIRLKDEKISISCSVGIATYPKNGTSFDQVMDAADHAMYLAKRKSKQH